MRSLLQLTLCLMPLHSVAWPVDWVHDVEVSSQKAIKLPRVDWFEIDDPATLSIEWVAESNELLLIGNKPGRATVLLGAEGKVAAWRVRVASPPVLEPSALALAKRACPELKSMPLEDIKFTVTVPDEACRKALLAWFQTDAVEARSLSVTFEGKVLQAQLRSLEEGLATVTKGKVKARYVGAGLVVTGQVSAAEHRKMLWEILRRTVGRFALDDQTQQVD